MNAPTRGAARFGLAGPGQVGIYADSTATVTAIYPQLPGEVVFHVVVRPPQTGMQSCSFRVSMSVWPTPPLGLERQLAGGVVDLDPSEDGYDLRFDGGCLAGGEPVVMATYRFLTIAKPTAIISVQPRGTETLFPTAPAYVPCGTAVELPLRPNPDVCEYSTPGTLEINGGGCALIGAYQVTYAAWMPPFADQPGQQVTVPIRASTSMLLSKLGDGYCPVETNQRITSFQLDAAWDPSLATVLSVDPAPATLAWNMESVTEPGWLEITAESGDEPGVTADETPMAYVTFQLANRLACSGITTRISTVRDTDGDACPTSWLSSSFLIGCTKGDLTRDAEITAGDAVIALQLADGSRDADYEALCAGDIDGRFFVDDADADNVLRLAVGLPPQIGSVPYGYLWKAPAATEYVELELDEVFGAQASIQFDPAALQFGAATCAGALVRARVVEPGVVRVAMAARAGVPRTIRIAFAAAGSHEPVRLVGVRGFDQDGRERQAPYSFPDGAVSVGPTLTVLGATRLLPAAPNPFNPRTMLRFVIARPGPVRLSIHDAAGRKVRSFAHMWLEAGPHEVPWDGQDNAGHAAASGVYRLRLVAPDGIDQRRSVVLLR